MPILNSLPENGFNLRDYMDSIENHYLLEALNKTGGNMAQAGSLLGMKRTTLRELLRRKGFRYNDPENNSIKMVEDPEGEFTYDKLGVNRWAIRYKGEVIAYRSSLKAVDTFIRRKIDG
jgi:hypothetical protein